MNRIYQKIISLILALCMVFTTAPVAFAGTDSVKDSSDEIEPEVIQFFSDDVELSHEETTSDSQAKSADELTSDDILADESSESITTYDMGNGRRMSVIESTPVRYLDGNGNLTDFDLSLTELNSSAEKSVNVNTNSNVLSSSFSSSYILTNKSSKYKTYIPSDLSENTPILLENSKYSISMSPIGNLRAILNKSKVKGTLKKNPSASDNSKDDTVIYGSSDDEASFEYTSLFNGLKETVILNEKPKNNSFLFRLKLENLEIDKSSDGRIILLDKNTGEPLAELERPFMNDATGEAFNDSITCAIKRNGNYKLEIVCNHLLKGGSANV